MALSDGCQLRCRGGVTPGQQFVQPSDLVIGDAAEDISQPCLRIDAVELGGFDQGVGDCSGFTAALGADEKIILPAQGDTAHCALG